MPLLPVIWVWPLLLLISVRVALPSEAAGRMGKLIRIRLPPPVLAVMLSPVLAVKLIFSRPSAGEFAVRIQSLAPPAPALSDRGTLPRLTSGVARLPPTGKLNTPVG